MIQYRPLPQVEILKGYCRNDGILNLIAGYKIAEIYLIITFFSNIIFNLATHLIGDIKL